VAMDNLTAFLASFPDDAEVLLTYWHEHDGNLRDGSLTLADYQQGCREARQVAAVEAEVNAERERADREAMAAAQAAEKRERDAKEALEQAEIRRVAAEKKAEDDRIAAEAKAIADREAAVLAEKLRAQKEAARKAAEDAKREADQLHVATIQQAVIGALRDMGMLAEAAHAVVQAIHAGEIPHVKIVY